MGRIFTQTGKGLEERRDCI